MSNYCERCDIIIYGIDMCLRCIRLEFLLEEYKKLKDIEDNLSIILTSEEIIVKSWLSKRIADLEIL